MSAAQKLVLEYYKAKLNLMHVVNTRWAAMAAIDLFQKPYAGRRRQEPAIWKESKKMQVRSGKETLAGYHWKADRSEKKMLIVHGFAGNARSFAHFIGPAMAKGYDVMAFDAPAHGKSTGRRLNLLSYTWALEDILKNHGPFDSFLAHSLGGMSLLLALRQIQPHRQAKAILVAPLVEAHRAAESFGRFLQLRPGLMQQMEAEIAQMAGHPLQWFSLPGLLPYFKGEILWVHDRNDDTTPFADVEPHLPHLPPHVEMMITEGLGHSRIYRDNQVKKRILEKL
jgi:pimeloyl-ACP methyl ester carboxylesterase